MKYSRESRYISGCDGTLLAVDLYLPKTKKKVPLLMNAGYEDRRSRFEKDREHLEQIISAGYALVIVDVRGSGASYGVSDGFFGRQDGKDLAGILDTLAKEDWCNGRTGTFGGSNYGMSQEITMIEQPSSLFASIPCDNSMDFYDQDFPNGASAVPEFKTDPNSGPVPKGTPVDDDPAPEYPMLKEALKARNRNLPFLAQHFRNMCRDDMHPYLGYRPNLEIPSWERMDTVRFGHTNVWSYGAWFDPGCTNKILTYKSWGGKLLLGPWPHCGVYRGANEGFPDSAFDWVNAHLRFFDHWLKEQDNGIDQEPPVLYYTVNDPHPWKQEADFPVSGTLFTKLYAGSDGTLTDTPVPEGSVRYTVRNDINIYGPAGRMNRNVTKDMRSEDDKSIVFTGDVLPEPLELTGIPSAELWVTSTHTDGNFIAVLEEVMPDGTSHFLTEGVIRASHARTHRNPVYASMGIPYHRGYRSDLTSLSEDTPMKLSFHLEALSRIIPAGNRLRLSVSCGGSGYQQPDGFPEKMPEITLYTGGKHASLITLPVIEPTITCFRSGDDELHVFKRAVYIKKNGRFTCCPCLQVYPDGRRMIYETADFRVIVKKSTSYVTVETEGSLQFSAKAKLPQRHVFRNGSPEIPLMDDSRGHRPDSESHYVASVPVQKGDSGNINPMMRSTFDLYTDIVYPQNAEHRSLPCIINIHGFGGNHHQFEETTDAFLAKGYAVASIDYRLTPPETWRSPVEDAAGCIRWLKANAKKLGLDPERFGLIGGSMGGYLTAMLAACNGKEPAGIIGGNTSYNAGIKAAVALFAPCDLLHFGDDCAAVWPSQPEKTANGDGPFAPIASMIGYTGHGRGVADIKAHLNDADPFYRSLLAELRTASPISHIHEASAPLCLVHGIFDCAIQVPFGQSVRMFEAYTVKGVKSLLLCNNNGFYGRDPEVQDAMVRFLCDRV